MLENKEGEEGQVCLNKHLDENTGDKVEAPEEYTDLVTEEAVKELAQKQTEQHALWNEKCEELEQATKKAIVDIVNFHMLLVGELR